MTAIDALVASLTSSGNYVRTSMALNVLCVPVPKISIFNLNPCFNKLAMRFGMRSNNYLCVLFVSV